MSLLPRVPWLGMEAAGKIEAAASSIEAAGMSSDRYRGAFTGTANYEVEFRTGLAQASFQERLCSSRIDANRERARPAWALQHHAIGLHRPLTPDERRALKFVSSTPRDSHRSRNPLAELYSSPRFNEATSSTTASPRPKAAPRPPAQGPLEPPPAAMIARASRPSSNQHNSQHPPIAARPQASPRMAREPVQRSLARLGYGKRLATSSRQLAPGEQDDPSKAQVWTGSLTARARAPEPKPPPQSPRQSPRRTRDELAPPSLTTRPQSARSHVVGGANEIQITEHCSWDYRMERVAPAEAIAFTGPEDVTRHALYTPRSRWVQPS